MAGMAHTMRAPAVATLQEDLAMSLQLSDRGRMRRKCRETTLCQCSLGLEKSVLYSGREQALRATDPFELSRQLHRMQKMGMHAFTTHERQFTLQVDNGVRAAIARNDNLATASDFLEEKDSGNFLNVEWKDGELDELFENFGETLYVDPNLAEIAKANEDDTEAEKFAIAMATAAYDTKAVDIRVLYVKSLVNWTRYFVVVSAFSRPQIDAITKKARDVATDTFNRTPYGGDNDSPTNWTLLDFGDVIMHIFLPKERQFYDLEGYYIKAKEVELPFVSPTLM